MARTETTELTPETGPKQEPLIDDKDFFYWTIRDMLQDLLEAEMTSFLGAKPRERVETRQGYRSGHRPRSLNTRVGRLQFQVPCERSGRFQTRLFDRYQRSEQAFILTLQEMYLHGVSTRRVRQITEAMCSLPISASEVSRMTAKLDESLERWRRRRLTEPYFALLVDARYEHIRVNDHVGSQAVVTTTGISAKTGQREILGVYVVNSESETSWSEVFRDLLQRGLAGIEYVGSDAHEGLKAAISRLFQGILWGRCQRHFSVDARNKVLKRDRKDLTFALRSIFDACDLAHARERAKEVVEQWRSRYAELADWLEANIEETLSSFHFPPSFRSRLRTTSMPERYNEELNRRSRVIRIFPNIASCLRLMTAMAQEQTELWAEQEPYVAIKELSVWKQVQAVSVPEPAVMPKTAPAATGYCRQ
jgi:putative transposase